jgi:hypothetical protein
LHKSYVVALRCRFTIIGNATRTQSEFPIHRAVTLLVHPVLVLVALTSCRHPVSCTSASPYYSRARTLNAERAGRPKIACPSSRLSDLPLNIKCIFIGERCPKRDGRKNCLDHRRKFDLLLAPLPTRAGRLSKRSKGIQVVKEEGSCNGGARVIERGSKISIS